MLFVLAAIFFLLGVALWILDVAGRRPRSRAQGEVAQVQSQIQARPEEHSAAIVEPAGAKPAQLGTAGQGAGANSHELAPDFEAGFQQGAAELHDNVPSAQPDRAGLQYAEEDPRDVIDAEAEEELGDLVEVHEQQAQAHPVGVTDDVVEVSTSRPKPQPRVEATTDAEIMLSDAAAEHNGELSTERQAEAQHQWEAEHPAPAKRHAFASLPGALKREKKAWAALHGYEYTKQDAYLAEEWTRGAAASGAVAKDVVSGVANGYEVHLLDLGGVTVMAMRHAAGSDVVVDAQKTSEQKADPTKMVTLAEDLMPVASVAGFEVSATDQGVGRRFLDDRVRSALAALPEQVTVVWWEQDWVLAQLAKGAEQEVWNATLGPLAGLAGAARALPPRKGAQLPVDFHEFDPTRPLVHTPTVAPEPESDELPDLPTVPADVAEHVELPSRATGHVLGEMERHEIGEDTVRVIGSGEAQPAEDFQGTRVLRDTSAGSSIFDDIVAELGDPTTSALPTQQTKQPSLKPESEAEAEPDERPQSPDQP